MRFFIYLANIPATRYSLFFPFAYIVLIYGLSSIPGSPPAPHDWHHRVVGMVFNAMHIPLYAGLTWLWRWSFSALITNRRFVNILAFSLTIGCGIFDEWHQSFTPFRDSSFTDIILDATGAILALWLFSKCLLAKDVVTHINYRSS
jgi:VanZ family protein